MLYLRRVREKVGSKMEARKDESKWREEKGRKECRKEGKEDNKRNAIIGRKQEKKRKDDKGLI